MPKTGRKPKWPVDKVDKFYKDNPESSVRNTALKLRIPSSSVQYIKTKKLGIKSYVKEAVPKYTGDQALRAKRSCRKLYRNILPASGEKLLIIDDETYVPIDPTQIPGKRYFHARSKKEVSDNTRFKPKQKFTKKYLIWQAVDQLGNVSKSYISEENLDGTLYKNECLKKRLLPFIKKYHPNKKILFWPDLATSHYRKDVQEWLTANGIDFVKKENNPPNVPQARPIERYWALCKTEYRKLKTAPKDLPSFKRKWRQISKKVAQNSAQQLMSSIKRKLRAIGDRGVLAAIKENK